MDETSVQCGHRYARLSYRAQTHKNKKRKDFVKVIAVHESDTAYCWDFLVDERKGVLIYDMVVEVLCHLPDQHRHTVACDRYYSSPKTFQLLMEKSVYLYGTLGKNRGAPASFTSEKFAPGLIKSAFNGQLSLTAWKDSGDVLFLSTFHGNEVSTVSRRAKGVRGLVTKAAPLVAVDYNNNMGGCDQFNSIMELRSCRQTHIHRWYCCFIYYALDILFINATVYYNKSPHINEELLDNKMF
jgi:hypothetical protein